MAILRGLWALVVRWWVTILLVFLLFLGCVIFYYMSRASHERIFDAATEIVEQVQHSEKPPGTTLKMVMAHIESLQRDNEWKEAFFHLSVALFVAAMIVLCVDIVSRHRTDREAEAYKAAVAESVFRALSGRLVNDQVGKELAGLLKYDVVREETTYTLRFLRIDDPNDPRVVVRREISYTVRNIASGSVKFVIPSRITSEHCDEVIKFQGEECILPRHCQLTVDLEDVELSQAKGTLRSDQAGALREIGYCVPLENDGSAEIFIASEELLSTRYSNVYVQMHPAVGLKIEIDNQCKDLIWVTDVTMNHPRTKELKRKPNGTYVFQGGILPGQSFTVIWEPVRKQLERPVSAGGEAVTLVAAIAAAAAPQAAAPAAAAAPEPPPPPAIATEGAVQA